jgi:hypothetical protein
MMSGDGGFIAKAAMAITAQALDQAAFGVDDA